MKLDDFLRARGLTSLEFGRMCGIQSKQTIHNYRHGIRFPTHENLRRIREATQGAVTSEDFVDQHAGRSEPIVLPPPVEPKPRAKRLAAPPALDPPPPAPESAARPRRRAA